MTLRISALVALVMGLAMSSASAQIEIQWWHAMTGANNEVVTELAGEFNRSQNDYRIVPVFKGTYPETLEAGMAAFKAGRPPHIIQIFDVGTGVMMNTPGAIMPVADVLEIGGTTFEKDKYLSAIVAYYSTPDGTMLSFPYNSSSPILYYNRDIYERAGLDPDTAPTTWPEVWADARRIVRSGAAPCGYTSTWFTWVHLENFAAWNNLPYATKENGLAGSDIELTINAPIFVRHMQNIAELAEDGVYRYGGRTSAAKHLFMLGECGILTESSGGLGDVIQSGINFGIGPLPYEPAARGAPQNTVPGGASQWVFAGHPFADYKGVAAFFQFLSQTDIQSRLHQASGYLPVTMEAYRATRDSGFYDAHPGREQPILQMISKEPTAHSRGIRAVNLPELRDIQNEELEAMLAGQQSARQALNNAVRRGNAAIKEALNE